MAGEFVPGRGAYPVEKLPEKDVRLLRSRSVLDLQDEQHHTPTETPEGGEPPRLRDPLVIHFLSLVVKKLREGLLCHRLRSKWPL